jgi:hypothetical protein
MIGRGKNNCITMSSGTEIYTTPKRSQKGNLKKSAPAVNGGEATLAATCN